MPFKYLDIFINSTKNLKYSFIFLKFIFIYLFYSYEFLYFLC